MVSEPEYPDGFPLFTYETPERMATVGLFHPKDGSPPLTLAELREKVSSEAAAWRQQHGKPNDFLEQMLAALDEEIAHRAAREGKPPAA